MAKGLGSVLRAAREAAGLTQAAAARAARIDASALSRVESQDRGDLRFETVARLAVTYGVSLDAIAAQCGFPATNSTNNDRTMSAIAMALESLRTAGRAEEDLATAIREALAVLRDTLPRKRRPNR